MSDTAAAVVMVQLRSSIPTGSARGAHCDNAGDGTGGISRGGVGGNGEGGGVAGSEERRVVATPLGMAAMVVHGIRRSNQDCGLRVGVEVVSKDDAEATRLLAARLSSVAGVFYLIVMCFSLPPQPLPLEGGPLLHVGRGFAFGKSLRTNVTVACIHEWTTVWLFYVHDGDPPLHAGRGFGAGERRSSRKRSVGARGTGRG